MATKQKRNPGGRAALKFTPALKARICRDVALGKSLRKTLKAASLPKMTRVMEELQKDTTFAKQYASARARGIELHIDGILDLADSATPENAQAVRLKVDVRKWLASKILPKVYGDKLELEAGAQIGSYLRDESNAIGVARRVAFAMAAGAIAMRAKQPRVALPAPKAPAAQQTFDEGPRVERALNPDPRDDGTPRLYNPNASAHEMGTEEK